MASCMSYSAFRCITVPCARPRFVMDRPGGVAPGGAGFAGHRVPIFLEASVYRRRR